MKFRLSLLIFLILILCSCSGQGNIEPSKLDIPIITINNDGVASWNEIINADSYFYVINNILESETFESKVTLNDGDSIKVKAIGDGIKFLDSDFSNVVTYNKPADPIKLASPVVSITVNGLAIWEKIEGATKYLYSLNGNAAVETINNSIQLADNDSIKVKAIGDGVNYLDSDYSEVMTYEQPIEPVKLENPVVTVNNMGIASWIKVEGATKYAYVINNNSAVEINGLSIQVYDGDSIKVMAIGDGVNYLNSDYSDLVEFEVADKLPSPIVTISTDGVASWSEIDGAIKYVYCINNQNPIETNSLSVQLINADSIKVMAIGDKISYKDSDYSDLNTFNAVESIEPTKLQTPSVSISNTGVATWIAIENATKYAYSINGNTAVETTELNVQLYDGDSIKVMAIGDNVYYANSDYSIEKDHSSLKLDAPIVTVTNTGIASWSEIAGASKYAYSINGNTPIETQELSITLINGDIIKVMAIGDQMQYANSEYSDPVECIIPIKLSTPNITINSTGLATWNLVDGAVKYAYSINGGNFIEINGNSIQLSLNQSIVVKAIGDGIYYLDSENSESKKYDANGGVYDDGETWGDIF